MTDYTKLVKALRGCKDIDYCTDCPRMEDGYTETCNIKDDAADAIEALQAENPIVESVLVDKMRQQMEETVCHCNVKENAELIARILDDDVDGKVFELSKRGEWEPVPDPEGRPYKYVCSNCHRFHVNEDEWYGYCPNCGAVMGVPIMDGPIITPCRGCSDYDGYGGCKSKGGCARAKMEVQDESVF